MKPLRTLLLLAVLVSLLSGCGLFTRQPPQERVVYKFIRVPTELTQKVAITAPPEPVFYSKLPWDKQEELLMGLIQEHTKSIGTCNARLFGVDSWSGKQLKIYEPANP